jgi:hypothetical protein
MEKKLTQHQIDTLCDLDEGVFFDASSRNARTLNILASRDLIKRTSDGFWQMTIKGVDELNAVRPL